MILHVVEIKRNRFDKNIFPKLYCAMNVICSWQNVDVNHLTMRSRYAFEVVAITGHSTNRPIGPEATGHGQSPSSSCSIYIYMISSGDEETSRVLWQVPPRSKVSQCIYDMLWRWSASNFRNASKPRFYTREQGPHRKAAREPHQVITYSTSILVSDVLVVIMGDCPSWKLFC